MEEIQKPTVVEKAEKKPREPKPKLCKECGSTENHFGLRRNSLCTPCRSKKSNAHANSNEYFKKYYENNKEKMKESAKDYYYNIAKLNATKFTVQL